MNSSEQSGSFEVVPADAQVLREVLGHLNFSSGKRDPGFERNINRIHARFGPQARVQQIARLLAEELDRLSQNEPAFSDSSQATAVLELTTQRLLPAYRDHHRDLLFHLRREDFEQPFLLALMLEAVLRQGGPWTDSDRIVEGALHELNDFVGYRPVAVLENDVRMQPYAHERYRPVPLFIRGAGVAGDRYHALISRMMQEFEHTPADLLRAAHFDLSRLQEFAVDMRAHDHLHPVNKRTNYMFGEWDPHQVDVAGYYHRFVVRKIILDSLLQWLEEETDGLSEEEALSDAASVLCGTVLMSSSISGESSHTHDSMVSLGTLLPGVARLRDAWYDWLLSRVEGPRRRRLIKEAERTRQPFGHVRQYLNRLLSSYGAHQMQNRQLSMFYARLGQAEAARQQAAKIPAPSVRFETEIVWRVSAAHLHLDRGELAPARGLITEIEDLIDRGISCGALIDPWNILGFQGHFPLFSAREDAVPDERADLLLGVMEQLFRIYSRCLGEAAVQQQPAMEADIRESFRRAADRWDRYATSAVEELMEVHGAEDFASAQAVARGLSEWRAAGESSGDISFWRRHVEVFTSAKAYAQVVETLLNKRDHVAAMGLLMQWLAQADEVGLDAGQFAIHPLLIRWMQLVAFGQSDAADPSTEPPPEAWLTIRRLFDYLEANAGPYWMAPTLGEAAGQEPEIPEELATSAFGDDDFDDEEDEDDEDSLFQAAYDHVTYRDSTDDGIDSDLAGGNSFDPMNSEFEHIRRYIEPRLAFLATVARLWQMAAVSRFNSAGPAGSEPDPEGGVANVAAGSSEDAESIRGWYQHCLALQAGIARLLVSLEEFEVISGSGDPEDNAEFDMQLQTKLHLMHIAVETGAELHTAGMLLLCCLSDEEWPDGLSEDHRLRIHVMQTVLRRDVNGVRRLLPHLTRHLSRKPLLYVALEAGGSPGRMLAVKNVQSYVRCLLIELPRLGLLQETGDLLRTALRMERASRPTGRVITEFDRLFRTALRSTLDAANRANGNSRPTDARPRPASAQSWSVRPALSSHRRGDGRAGKPVRRLRPRPVSGPSSGGGSGERSRWLVDAVGQITHIYSNIWNTHSRTIRLSTLEGITDPEDWEGLQEFVTRYGGNFLHARLLALGNVRGIVQNGVENFLEYLEENEDPLNPVPLIDDIRVGQFEREHAVDILDLLYSVVIEKYDRYIEYNTTTTQSDYGEMFGCLLDFLRLESRYDRDDWKLKPVRIAHQSLSASRCHDAAVAWEQLWRERTAPRAERYIRRLLKLQKQHAIQMPLISDHLEERFIKPMSVNRMLALIPAVAEDARRGRTQSAAFTELRREIDEYLSGSAGSGIDIPDWMRRLDRHIEQATGDMVSFDEPVNLVRQPVRLGRRQLEFRVGQWQRRRRK